MGSHADFRSEMNERFEGMRRHFDITAEHFRSECRNLFDWVHVTVDSQGARIDHREQAHGARLDAVELRVTRLEHPKST